MGLAGPRYPMGVYLDELRVTEVMKDSIAEKVGEAGMSMVDICLANGRRKGNLMLHFVLMYMG